MPALGGFAGCVVKLSCDACVSRPTQVTSLLPISQWCPHGSAIRPILPVVFGNRRDFGCSRGQSPREDGIRVVNAEDHANGPPSSPSGLEAASAAIQKSAPSIER
jgi:hypothetical protein